MFRWLAKILGPMFVKEMLEMSRRRRTYVNRVLYGATLLIVAFFVWEDQRWFLRNARPIEAMSRLASTLFVGTMCVQFAAVYLFVPIFVSGVICGEREERTLELLFTTHLVDREIVLGKLASRLVAVLLIILGGVPMLALIGLWGGVDLPTLLRSWCATLLAAVFTGSFAIYFSTVSRSTVAALLRTYFWLGLWLIVVPLAMMVCLTLFGTGLFDLANAMFRLMAFTNPLVQIPPAVDPFVYRSFTSSVAAWFFPVSFVVPGAFSLWLVLFAIRRLRDPQDLATSAFGRFGRFKGVRALVQRLRAIHASWRRQSAESTCWGRPVENPLWLRARIERVYDRGGHIGRIQLAAWLIAMGFVLLVAMSEPQALKDEETVMVFLAPVWVTSALITAIVSATGVVGDRRRGFLDLVLVTPLEARELLDGTFRAALTHVRGMLWLPVPLAFMFVLTGAISFAQAFTSVTAGTLLGLVIVALGTACSWCARTTPQALVATIGLPIGLYLAVGAAFGLSGEHYIKAMVACLLPGLFATMTWTRLRLTPASVGAHFLAVQFALSVALGVIYAVAHDVAVYSVGPGWHSFSSYLVGQPYMWTMVVLDRPFQIATWGWFFAAVGYFSILVLNLIWCRSWLIRHFDRLTGRVTGPRLNASGGHASNSLFPRR
jgi:ABC-type transport system involved in multi-copper enzyme maturation permease subunit